MGIIYLVDRRRASAWNNEATAFVQAGIQIISDRRLFTGIDFFIRRIRSLRAYVIANIVAFICSGIWLDAVVPSSKAYRNVHWFVVDLFEACLVDPTSAARAIFPTDAFISPVGDYRWRAFFHIIFECLEVGPNLPHLIIE